jgi:biotin carboxylase
MVINPDHPEITLVVIGAGEFQLPLIERAIERGYKVIGIDGNDNAIGFNICNESYVIDIKNSESIIRLLKKRNKKIDAVLTLAAEIAVVTVSKIAKEFNLIAPSVNSSNICTNKYLMRKCFKKNKIPSPNFDLILEYSQINKIITKYKYPFVLKPIDNAGSRGVVIVENEFMLLNSFKHALSFSKSGKVLLEEFMDGVEISVEAFVQNNEIVILSLSDKIRTPFPYPLDTHVIFPSNKSKKIQNEAIEIAKAAIKASGLNNSIIHMELMVTNFGVKVVEMAARGAGFHVFSKMLKWVCGINTIDLLIDISLGIKILKKEYLKRGAILYFPSSSVGTVKSISGLNEIKKLKQISDIKLTIQPGDKVNLLKSGSDRIGHVLTFAMNRKDAIKTNMIVENLLKINMINE